MSTTSAPIEARRGSEWLTDWDPEDEATWNSGLAWRTLWISTFALLLAFCTWFLASAIAPQLTALGFDLSKEQLYWLTAMPGLAGGTLRLVWMFLPPILGTRKLVLALADGRRIEAVYIPDTPKQTFCISTLVGCAMACGFCLTGKMGLVRHLTAGEICGLRVRTGLYRYPTPAPGRSWSDLARSPSSEQPV